MINHNMISVRLAQNFICLALNAEKDGQAIGSTSEQIVAALLNGRVDWLPASYPEPLSAIKRLHAEGAEWWHTMLLVHEALRCG